MKKTILIFITIAINSNLLFSQILDVSAEELTRSGNVFIKDLTKSDFKDIDGSPYLNNKFQKGKIIFENNKIYSGYIRLNIGAQKFEIKKNINSKETIIEIDNSVNVLIEENKYNLQSFKIDNKQVIGILEECIVFDNLALYYYPKKNIKMPTGTGTIAPTTGYSKPPQPKWVDASEFLILKEDIWYTIPNSFKKLVSKKIFDSNSLKKYKKSNKLQLRKKESLIDLVSYFNSI